jgi:hypothetical protein
MPLPAALRRLAAASCLVALGLCAGPGHAQAPSSAAAGFAATVSRLSEPGGYFDTDNLISNEHSYLTVVPEIERSGITGGAYIGVGPDQSFSYIAAARPSVAFIVDVRRDNLLLHLLFKALFSLAGTRVEYLALLCGRPAPTDLDGWAEKNVADVTRYIDAAATPETAWIEQLRERVTARVRSFDVPLSTADLQTIDRFHRRFIEDGLGLRFQSLGRSPQGHYPTFRQLLLAEDGAGRQRNYLASEAAFRFVKTLQARDLVIPVVGDLSGSRAVVGIARWLREHDERLSIFYASNVEFYLFRDGSFPRFVDNLSRLPRAERAVLVRSVFGRAGGFGGGSVSLTQPVSELVEGFADGRYRVYWELVR